MNQRSRPRRSRCRRLILWNLTVFYLVLFFWVCSKTRARAGDVTEMRQWNKQAARWEPTTRIANVCNTDNRGVMWVNRVVVRDECTVSVLNCGGISFGWGSIVVGSVLVEGCGDSWTRLFIMKWNHAEWNQTVGDVDLVVAVGELVGLLISIKIGTFWRMRCCCCRWKGGSSFLS